MDSHQTQLRAPQKTPAGFTQNKNGGESNMTNMTEPQRKALGTANSTKK